MKQHFICETEAYRKGICVKTDMEFNWEKSEFLLGGAKGTPV